MLMFGTKIQNNDDFCVPMPKVLICFIEMKKILSAFAALITLAACGNKQTAAPEKHVKTTRTVSIVWGLERLGLPVGDVALLG